MSDLFDRARAAMKLEDLAGKLVKLHGRGGELRGQCPICEASPSSGSVFKVDVDRQTWFCFGCKRRGDVVDLYAWHHRMDLVDAAKELAGPAPRETAPLELAKEKPISDGDRDREARIARLAADMVSASRPLAGTLAERYLIGRGIDAAIVARLDGPRFHPDAPHSWNPEARAWRRAPAIINRVVTPGGWAGGVHATYLSNDGLKSALSPRKLMWGPQGDETPFGKRRGGSWLIGSFPDDGDLVVGEGVESTLALASDLHRKGLRDFGAVAALSLGALQGGLQRDRDGCVDLAHPKGDPDVAAFTWPPCYTAGQKPPRALIGVDRDMSPQKVSTRTGRGKIVDSVLDAEDRAKLCAILAVAAWTRAGWNAHACMPPPGCDWNDGLLRLGRS